MLAEGERCAEMEETSESAPLVAIIFGMVAVLQRLDVIALHVAREGIGPRREPVSRLARQCVRMCTFNVGCSLHVLMNACTPVI